MENILQGEILTQESLNKPKERSSNFELLRIVAMLLIIMHHYSVHGNFQIFFMDFSFNKLIIQFFAYGGKLGVNLFVLISGYFLIDSKFKLEKAIKLYIDTTIYSLVILIAFLIAGEDIDKETTLQFCFPLFYQLWWFLSIYFIMYILSNYINIFIKNISRKQHLGLIIILLILLSILPYLPEYFKTDLIYSRLTWFFLMYLSSSYIKLYDIGSKKTHGILIGILIYAFCLGLCALFYYLAETNLKFLDYAMQYSTQASITMYFCSIFLFIGFKNLNIKYSRDINMIGASTFGVYMLHEAKFMKEFLWQKLFKNAQYANSKFLIFHAIISVFSVFVLTSLLSIIYNYTIGKGTTILSKKLSSLLRNTKLYKYFSEENEK